MGEDSLTIGQVMQIGVWGIGIGSLFFTFVGMRSERDIMLLTGLVACVIGDAALAVYLWGQGSDAWEARTGDPAPPFLFRMAGVGDGTNDTLASAFACLAVFALYAIHCQFERYREKGFMFDEEEEGGAEEEQEKREDTTDGSKPAAPQLADAPAGSGKRSAKADGGGARKRR